MQLDKVFLFCESLESDYKRSENSNKNLNKHLLVLFLKHMITSYKKNIPQCIILVRARKDQIQWQCILWP